MNTPAPRGQGAHFSRCLNITEITGCFISMNTIKASLSGIFTEWKAIYWDQNEALREFFKSDV